MSAAVLWVQWIALAFLFLIGSIWSEDNVRFGYIITALFGYFFYSIGWLQFAYLSTVIPIIVIIAAISFLRSHLKYKFGVFGSQGGLIWKIMAFCIMIQLAIVFTSGIGIFNSQLMTAPTNEFTGYTVINSTTSMVQGYSTGIGAVDIALSALTLGWMSLQLLWAMILSFFTLYPTLVTLFKLDAGLAGVIAAGFYILTAIELLMLFWKPLRSLEI